MEKCRAVKFPQKGIAVLSFDMLYRDAAGQEALVDKTERHLMPDNFPHYSAVNASAASAEMERL